VWGMTRRLVLAWRLTVAIAITAVAIVMGYGSLQFAISLGYVGDAPFTAEYLNEIWQERAIPTALIAQGVTLFLSGLAGTLWFRLFRD